MPLVKTMSDRSELLATLTELEFVCHESFMRGVLNFMMSLVHSATLQYENSKQG